MYVLGFLFWLALAGLVGFVASERNRSPLGWGLVSLLFSPIIGFLGLIAAGDAETKQNGEGPKNKPWSEQENAMRDCLRSNEMPFPASHETCPCCGNPVDDGEHPLV